MNIEKPVKKELNYFKLDGLNASSIKTFNKNRQDFYKQFILKEKKKQLNSDAVVLGSIIDEVLTNCNGSFIIFEQNFDEKFCLLSVKKGTGQLFLLADYLYDYTIRDTNSVGNITSDFLSRFTEAFEQCQKDGKFSNKKVESVLEQFAKSDAETYLKEKLESTDKIVVDMWMLDKAKKCVENVLLDENVNYIFQYSPDNLGKVVLEFEYMGEKCKCEIDNLSVNHSTKEIIITELKSTWQAEEFWRIYLDLRYDISATFYLEGVKLSLEKLNLPKDYDIKFQFLAVDTSPANLRPTIYTLSEEDLNKAKNGYTINRKLYKGLDELIGEIKWATENNIWNTTKEIFENNSKIPLKINYDN